ncbi:OmpP1/FadL family transporter [Tranquillimonas alkanivorans]|uniref:Long-chain fatty acid transport protein n=1 Tax=Tranquillimonas alkanivorans TaxID=441119 RepID=A0A1I5P1H9_9RHOB|nr:outer membrane beta-barrel protein [Tranquillimonas alkanivorans]SFP27958.1 Long-chain fatty acid transport protein [Tranquillimonas alkanivorans]
MRTTATAVAALALGAGAAAAGGVERSVQSSAILFEESNYASLSFGYASPDISGAVNTALLPPGASIGSGDMAEDYSTFSLGVKTQVNDRVSLALILDQPIGADVDYPDGDGLPFPNGPNYPYAGSTAEIDSTAVTALAKYALPSNFSVYGGLRIQQAEGRVSLPNVGAYTMETSSETDLGYVVGVAYEKPEIALRVALTYNSEITHDFSADEAFAGNAAPGSPTEFSTTVPQSVNLDFQTGIAEDTLLFGSVRWVDWDEFEIAPSIFEATTTVPLVAYDDDTITYTLGLGRRFNENWSGAVTVGYEPDTGGFSSNLGPTDGQTSLGLGLTYETETYEITGGVRYVNIGDAETTSPSTPGTALGQFDDNSAVAFGLRLGYKF